MSFRVFGSLNFEFTIQAFGTLGFREFLVQMLREASAQVNFADECLCFDRVVWQSSLSVVGS